MQLPERLSSLKMLHLSGTRASVRVVATAAVTDAALRDERPTLWPFRCPIAVAAVRISHTEPYSST